MGISEVLILYCIIVQLLTAILISCFYDQIIMSIDMSLKPGMEISYPVALTFIVLISPIYLPAMILTLLFKGTEL